MLNLLLSASLGHASPVVLKNIAVANDMCIFTNTTSDVVKVKFWLDITFHRRASINTKNNAPYDFPGKDQIEAEEHGLYFHQPDEQPV
ncbi:hypothetical protein METHB2_460015 [Candidatus Methylobacter favarea]|uniref:Uncharacterized protein n=1 Tax=Candidatus Methylobacter favarea TaxID=2707345 RepID=A0A8S0X245_9GAMM|nr:hypothetical protein [Candidatus Methylobacter favarea]CAA9891622.1 hypothetical protein METHB2_460015 [Candidatus Methylobacter favarea]